MKSYQIEVNNLIEKNKDKMLQTLFELIQIKKRFGGEVICPE